VLYGLSRSDGQFKTFGRSITGREFAGAAAARFPAVDTARRATGSRVLGDVQKTKRPAGIRPAGRLH
jgi:hypothetical protein